MRVLTQFKMQKQEGDLFLEGVRGGTLDFRGIRRGGLVFCCCGGVGGEFGVLGGCFGFCGWVLFGVFSCLVGWGWLSSVNL